MVESGSKVCSLINGFRSAICSWSQAVLLDNEWCIPPKQQVRPDAGKS